MTIHLHVAIGPVQTFVAQARRTRDLWAGSYLLSLLSAHAMRGARDAGGRIIRPNVDGDPLLAWVDRNQDELPRFGSLPNQFTVELVAADPDVVAAAIKRSFQAAWRRVCDAVWHDVVRRKLPLGPQTEAIWQRQTTGFWELVWVAGEPSDLTVMDRRKHWRDHYPPEEPGDKCTVMRELQELSGYTRAHERELQDRLWQSWQREFGAFELRDHERLCAIALIKRRYAAAAVVRDAIGGRLDVQQWPSTVDVAAASWVKRALEADPQAATAFASAVCTHAVEDPLTGGPSRLVRSSSAFARLGANWLHRAFVANPKVAQLKLDAPRNVLLDRLDALKKTPTSSGELGAPPIYYALLLADGDQLGELLRERGVDQVSSGLAAFTQRVPGVVDQHGGVTIYAGGDDVLAIFPLATALDAAQDLEKCYREALRPPPNDPTAKNAKEATLSAAVVFTHARAPLYRVLHEAHDLLDDVAKDGNGRASLAAAIYRGEEVAVQWATTWQRQRDGKDLDAATCIRDVVNALAPTAPHRLSTGLLHDLRRVLGLLCGDEANRPGHFAAITPDLDLAQLVRAEVQHRLAHQDGEPDDSNCKRLTQLLVALLYRAHRSDPEARVGMDGLMLASFLATGGREDDHTS